MFKFVKILLMTLILSIVLTNVTSCNEREIKYYKELCNHFYKNYPDGYDLKNPEWYEYTSELLVEKTNKEITLSTLSFIGYINFEKDSLVGKVTKFDFDYVKTTLKDREIVKYETINGSLNNGDFYSLREVIDNRNVVQSSVSIGTSNIDHFIIKTEFNDDIFYLNQYYKKLNSKYDLIHVFENMVKFENAYSNLYENHIKKTGFYYDEKFEIKEFFLFEHLTREKNSICFDDEILNKVLTKNLKLRGKFNINVPKKYDIEYEYNTEYPIILL